MGLYETAEPLSLQAMELQKTVLSEKHPDVANSLNNLANLYKSIGWCGKAEPPHLQAIDYRKTVLGERHPESEQLGSSLPSDGLV